MPRATEDRPAENPARRASPVIRRLWPSDLPAVEAHLLRLDAATRRDRFMGAMSDAGLLGYARRAVRAEGLMFGAFIDGTLRAIAELRPTIAGRAGLGREAEAAFEVEPAFRRAGIGTRLFRRLSRAARVRAVRRLKVRCLAQNRAMQALAREAGSRLEGAGYETSGALDLERPTALALWQEGIEESLDLTLAAAARLAAPSLAH